MKAAPEGLRITVLRRDDARGFWTAHLTLAGLVIPVERIHGSWQTKANVEGIRQDVLPAVAAALQARVNRLEKREAQEREEAAA
jgi:hypothetical protein